MKTVDQSDVPSVRAVVLQLQSFKADPKWPTKHDPRAPGFQSCSRRWRCRQFGIAGMLHKSPTG